MSREQWAGIVYGRSYHLDFRFIALPEDFGESEINWAFPHILATTQKPKKLSSNPRWSLFKNKSHCVVGTTCMVRDLLGGKEASLTKDDKDRPLYVFVGYVTRLTSRKYLMDLPPYNYESLADFEGLYDYVRQNWLVKDFHKDSHQPIITGYKKREFSKTYLQNNISKDLITKINYQAKSPDQVFLWQNTPKRNNQLWATAAVCSQSTSVCLGNSYIEQHTDNPFLNQTVDSQEVLTVKNRLISSTNQTTEKKTHPGTASLTRVLTNRVKQDLKITYSSALNLQHIVTNNLNNEIKKNPQPPESNLVMLNNDEIYDDFGFKTKVSDPNNMESENVKSDWF